ncbi:MAG: hypothetical protein AAF599_10820 [Bacteroidota bacterium]
MSTIATVKNNLHELVVNTQDAELLQKVEDYFRALVNGNDWWDELSHVERQLIQKGTDELGKVLGIPHNEVRQKVEAKLHKN